MQILRSWGLTIHAVYNFFELEDEQVLGEG